jgi:hypothetical protein
MSNDLVKSVSSGTKKLSFWNTKEGTTGMFLGFGLLGLAGYALYHILPFIITLLANAITAMALLGVIIAIAAVILEGTLPKRLWLIYKRLMWSLTYSFVKYDPAWLARDRQKAAKEKLNKAEDAKGNVKGTLQKIKSTIAGFQRDADDYQKKANYLQAHGGSEVEIRSYASRLQQAMNAINRLKPGADQIEVLDKKLGGVLEALKEVNIGLDYTIDATIREYEATQAMGSLLSGLRSAFRGDDDVEGLRDQALSFMSDETDHQFGQIDSFLEDVDKFMSNRNLESAIKADDGLKLLEDLNSRTLQLKVSPKPQMQPVSLDLSSGGKSSYWTK